MRQRNTGNKGAKLRRRKSSTRRNSRKSRRGDSSVAAAKETEVARLKRELNDALEQQAATAEILDVISNSPTDTQPVFDAIVQSGLRLFPGALVSVALRYGDMINAAAVAAPDLARVEAWRRTISRTPLARNYMHGVALLDRRVVDIPDVADAPAEFVAGAQNFLTSGNRAMTIMPMMRGDEAIGALSVVRLTPGPLSAKQLAVLRTFASQAVIAIENTRLFSELRLRTEDLRESLQQQTATADVLKVISRSTFDLQTVLDTLVESAARLCDADHAWLFQRDGEVFRFVASFGHTTEVHVRIKKFFDKREVFAERGSVTGRAALEARVVHVPDVLTDTEYTFGGAQEIGGYRSALGVPLLRKGEVVGVIFVGKIVAQPFTEKQIELVTTFADQGVIAIENTRLVNELRESLKQQTATADVLKVISRSAFDLQTVLDALTESAALLCDADMAGITRQDGSEFYHATNYNFPPDWIEFTKTISMGPGRGSVVGRVLLEGKSVQVADVLNDPEYTYHAPAKKAGYRTFLGVPLLREGKPIGVITLGRKMVRPFADNQIELVSTFADQAVIAIENVRLFDEVETRTRELARSVEELQALGEVSQAVNSTLELETVLTTIVGRAVQLSRTDAGAIYVFDMARNEFRLHATHGMSETMIAAISDQQISLRDSQIGTAAARRRPIQVSDIRNEPASPVNDLVLREGYRSILIIPLLRPDHVVGALVVRRKEPGEFPQSIIDLLQNFADQSAVAIQNARLFESVETRTRELAASLKDLQTAQDRLVQTEKLASLGQLTAGIAHEIKNPLNFVNNFSAISVQLVDELREALGGFNLDSKLRAEIDGIGDMLQGNLDKVVQHGKRADSIVKNMLLHSRQGSGEHRPVDINAVVEESLNLAYHGARAETRGFNVTLERSLDPAAGEVDLFPQEIARVLLNLISNGFYATTKRKAEASGDNYEPTLVATTKNLGDSVEIRIRDNGTGVPPEVRERMFNPFFTTKPAGEGTGLGLSISHDIIVKQHGGSIEVDTQPGAFTEVRIILPRTAALIAKPEGRA